MFLKTMFRTACNSKPHTTPQNAAKPAETVPKLLKTSRVVAERQRHLATEKRQLVFNVEDSLRIVAIRLIALIGAIRDDRRRRGHRSCHVQDDLVSSFCCYLQWIRSLVLLGTHLRNVLVSIICRYLRWIRFLVPLWIYLGNVFVSAFCSYLWWIRFLPLLGRF